MAKNIYIGNDIFRKLALFVPVRSGSDEIKKLLAFKEQIGLRLWGRSVNGGDRRQLVAVQETSDTQEIWADAPRHQMMMMMSPQTVKI